MVGYAGPAAPLRQALVTIGAQLDRDATVKRDGDRGERGECHLAVVRLAAGGVAALGGLALLLACTGVYGVVAFTVARRRREIGVRMALGAQPVQVIRLLVRQNMRPCARRRIELAGLWPLRERS